MKADKAPRGKKGGKDPKAPKRALSAYMFFSQDWRERIKAENPDAGFGEWFLLRWFGSMFVFRGTDKSSVQAKSESFSARSGRSSMMRRRRFVFCSVSPRRSS